MVQNRRIILVLDESGSMALQKSEIISGVNEMIRNQRNLQDGHIDFSIVKFNEKVTKVRENCLKHIQPLTSRDYNPNGMTALYDAIGVCINKYIEDKDTIMIIATDGAENSSREYTRQNMLDMIEKQRKTKNWNFIYLSEDPTTVKQGEDIGFTNSKYNCSNTFVGARQCGKTIGSNSLQSFISQVSKGETNQNYDDWQKFNSNTQTHSKPTSGFSSWNSKSTSGEPARAWNMWNNLFF